MQDVFRIASTCGLQQQSPILCLNLVALTGQSQRRESPSMLQRQWVWDIVRLCSNSLVVLRKKHHSVFCLELIFQFLHCASNVYRFCGIVQNLSLWLQFSNSQLFVIRAVLRFVAVFIKVNSLNVQFSKMNLHNFCQQLIVATFPVSESSLTPAVTDNSSYLSLVPS